MKYQDKKIIEILEILDKLKDKHDIRTLLIGEDFILYKGKKDFVLERFFSNELKDRINLDRGEVLELFSKIEVLVNALVKQSTIGGELENDHFFEILDAVDLFSKVRLLSSWEIINNKEESLIMRLKKVRNEFAHNWGIENIRYRDGYLSNEFIFEKFIEDFAIIWETLSLKYKVDLDSFLAKLEKQLQNESASKS